MIEVKNLEYSYGKIQAIKGISFTLCEGEIMSVIGANGAGKSTLMKCISGLLKHQKGEILFKDRLLPKKTHEIVKNGIVMVPEGRMIFPGLTVEENLLLGGYTSQDTKKGIERVNRIFPRMSERKNQRAGTLSGGEQQMLAIGRGLMANPKVLLLDEPSLGLAPLVINDIISIIKRINEEGVSVLLVEQNAKKALSISHNACLLETGRIIKTGTGKELLNDPKIIEAYLGGKKQPQ